jgi:protein SCO1
MKLRIFSLAVWSAVLAGGELNAAPEDGKTNAMFHDARGVVRQVAADHHAVTIQHEAIAGYMPAMTMEFPVKNTNELAGISPSDEITFKLAVHENNSWIEDIHFVAHRIENVTNGIVTIHVPTAELKMGDLLPDYELMTETGDKMHVSNFRGRVLAFTFFFTRCPLPEYCPRMSKNFAETRQLLLNDPVAPANWQFLSISFDPEIDQPAVLSSYAHFFRGGNSDRWLFASVSNHTLADLAPKLDLLVVHDEAGISHNLRTVVLDPQGRIFRQFDGNEWIPQKLADAMLAAARPLTNSMPP